MEPSCEVLEPVIGAIDKYSAQLSSVTEEFTLNFGSYLVILVVHAMNKSDCTIYDE